VGGDVSLSLFPGAGVSFSDLRLGNPPAFAEKDFLTVKSFDVQLKLLGRCCPGKSRSIAWWWKKPRIFMVTK